MARIREPVSHLDVLKDKFMASSRVVVLPVVLSSCLIEFHGKIINAVSLYLPPYSPDLNPIEEFFAELKAFVKKRWHEYEDGPAQDFGAYLEWCISVVGGNKHNAEGHCRHAGVSVEALHAECKISQ